MKRKFTVLIASLLLAVGWTNIASAQALPEGGYADRLGISDVAAQKITKLATKKVGSLLNARSTTTKANAMMAQAPTRATYERPAKVYPKSYYDTLTYSWSNPTTGESGTDVPATEIATDPYQIYELLRFVYMDPRFPGPLYNACSSTNEAEDPVYYGGIDGGWNIPYGPAPGVTVNPVGNITITTNSTYAYIDSIAVVSGDDVLTTWGATTSEWNSSTGAVVWGQGWSSSKTMYYYYYQSNYYDACYMSSGGTITIQNSLFQGKTNVQVYVHAMYGYSSGYTTNIAVNGENKSLSSDATDWSDLYWDVEGTSTGNTGTPTDVLITASNSGIDFSSIAVTDATTGSPITSWSAGSDLPSNWFANKELLTSNGYAYMSGGGTIRIAPELFEGHNSITVTVLARFSSQQSTSGTLQICDYDRSFTLSSTSLVSCATTINFPAVVATDTYKPKEQGYTALLVQVKNNNTIYTEPSTYLGAWEFSASDKASLIDYIGNNIKSVQLLTDGLRIGEGEGTGTVFNCSGTYNKFFFLGKGRARKKSSGVLSSIGLSEYAWPSYACEEGPFKYMFEQFSPTGGEEGSQITDFYIEMMDGNVYDVVHDCASVIQNGHQFSMSGNTGTQDYAMSGMNFFIPDYRLKYWRNDSIGVTNKTYQPNDGRDMNPYMVGDDNGKTGAAFRQATYFSVNYAQYNPQHSPKVGIYVITLDAEANPCSGYDPESNPNYVVTLDWTSSLNEMSGHEVPQTYVIYEVITNEDGSTRLDSITKVVGQTHYDFGGQLWPQGEHSESHTYIIKGWPTDNEHPSFIAWSNEDVVVIPGLNDFLMLNLDHYESDFDVPNMQNWYRNFLTVNNDGYVGLTTQGIFEGDSVFNLLRFENTAENVTKQVARLKFENVSGGRVKYTINYVDENGQSTQDIEAPKYQLTAMGIPTTGYLTTKNDGDIIIQPNGYDVNFLKITVTAGSYSKTWTSPAALPDGWSVSDGSMWVLENGAYYLEGGGYILIPAAILGNYTTATVTINAYGDSGKTAKIKVNNTSKAILNGDENARDYTWTVNNGSAGNLNFNANRATTTYEKVTSSDQLEEGKKYIFVYENGSSSYAMGSTLSNDTYGTANRVEVTLDGTTVTAGDDVAPFTLGISSNSTSSTTYLTFAYPDGTLLGSYRTGSSSNRQYWLSKGLGYTGYWRIYYNGNNYYVYDYYYERYIKYYNNNFVNSNSSSATYAYLYVESENQGGGTDPVQPTVDGVVRMANLRIVDQFAEEIPATNDHPYRYTYYLKLKDSEEGEKESSRVPVPVQHTGADVQGYYTLTEMNNDVDPENFLQENVISAQVDMNLSPTSAPYFYTINSVKDNVPPKADDYNTYVSVLQRRSAGDYQEMQASGKILGESSETAIPNPERNRVYESGNHNFFDYRKVTGELTDYLSYVPIIWTNGINRHYYVQDSLHNSYGAPIWKVNRGDVLIAENSTYVQRQMSSTGGWNPSTNWWVKNDAGTDSTAYGLYFVNLQATGVLPTQRTDDYEPYMFRLWLKTGANETLRDYEWQYNANGKPIKIVDAGENPGEIVAEGANAGQWYLLDTKMVTDGDLNYQHTITSDYANNLQFAGPLYNFKPTLVVRFYYKKKGAPAPNGLRGANDDDNVGYVVLRGSQNDPGTAVHEIQIVGEIVDQVFYNAQGMSSNRPFEGINIVVTRYSDGSTSTSKVRY